MEESNLMSELSQMIGDHGAQTENETAGGPVKGQVRFDGTISFTGAQRRTIT